MSFLCTRLFSVRPENCRSSTFGSFSAIPSHQILEPRDRQFWRIKGFDDVRAIFETENLQVRERKVKRMAKVVHFSLCNSTELTSSQDVRKLEAASKRNVQAFSHILAVAYGRKGKLKRELMEVGV
jgi:hypothetical protein